MIFRQEHIQQIIDGTMTETRRVVKPGERFVCAEDSGEHFILTAGGRVKLRVGQDYAVQPGCGYHGVYYDIDTGVIYGHGYSPLLNSMASDPLIIPLRIEILSLRYPKRLQDNPDVWVIKFEVAG